jgi:hypothetical protein
MRTISTHGPDGHRCARERKGASETPCAVVPPLLRCCLMSRRTRFTHVRRRCSSRKVPPANGGGEGSDEADWHDELEGVTWQSACVAMNGTMRLHAIAAQLWRSDYRELFALEYEQNKREVGGAGLDLTSSTYRRRLHGERAELYDQRRRQQERDQLAIALHANNQQHWSPSILARSVAYFNIVSDTIEKTEARQRRIASRPTTLNFLRMMRDCRSHARSARAMHTHTPATADCPARALCAFSPVSHDSRECNSIHTAVCL